MTKLPNTRVSVTTTEPTEAKLTERLTLIDLFIADPPQGGEFQMGYLSCLMDEACQDMDEAGSDTFEKALELFAPSDQQRYRRQRAITLR